MKVEHFTVAVITTMHDATIEATEAFFNAFFMLTLIKMMTIGWLQIDAG